MSTIVENEERDERASSSGDRIHGRHATNRKLAKAFGLDGETWMRHANPASVWTRFSVLPLLALAIWSRDWIGLWSLVPIAAAIAWMFVNPLRSRRPTSTRTELAERSSERDRVDRAGRLPEQFRSPAASGSPTATRSSAAACSRSV